MRRRQLADDAAALMDRILRSRPSPGAGGSAHASASATGEAWRGTPRCRLRPGLALGTRCYTSVAAILNNRQDRKR